MMKDSDNMDLQRRDFVKSAVAAIGAVATGVNLQSNACADDTQGNYIDAHSHIWTRDIDRYPLAAGKTLADLAPASFTDAELLAVAKPLGVSRVVLIQHHPYHGWDNSYLVDTAAHHPDTFRVVGQIDEHAADPVTKMQELAKQRVTGFRITPSTLPKGVSDKDWLQSPGMQSMWQAASQTRQNMCCLINPVQLAQVDAMCQKYPDTPVVIDHFARIGMMGEIVAAELESLCNLAKHPHVRVKASAYYALGKKRPPHRELLPMLRRVLDAFGPQRVMWASDAPYQVVAPNSYAASLAFILDEANFLSATDRDWLLRRTAEETFFFA